jgi:hypothetical protein
MARPKSNRIGQRFTRLVVLDRGTKRDYWKCQCDCGAVVEVGKSGLLGGRTKSCGCLRQQHYRRNAEDPQFEARRIMRALWHAMKRRCDNPKDVAYERYGGRGITVCQRWRDSFEAFFADMGYRPTDQHSIDRIDGNGNYEPDNCRWATAEVQHRNRSNAVIVDGITLEEFARQHGVSPMTLRSRMSQGMTAHEALAAKANQPI